MRRFVSSILMISLAFQNLSALTYAADLPTASDTIRRDDVLMTSGIGSLSERAYLYRQISENSNTPPSLQTLEKRAATNPDYAAALIKRMEDFEMLYQKHLEFETSAEIVRDYNVGDVQVKKDLVNLASHGVDGLISSTKASPLGIIAKPGLAFIKGKIVGDINKSYDVEIEKIELRSKQLIAQNFLRQLTKYSKLQNLNHSDAQKKYEEMYGSKSLILDKNLAKIFTTLSPEKQAAALYSASKQAVLDITQKYGNLDTALQDINSQLADIKETELAQKKKEAEEFLAAKTLMLELTENTLKETQTFQAILTEATSLYSKSSTSQGGLAAEGVMTHAKLDMLLGDTSFLVARELSKMSARELLALAGNNRSLPDGTKLNQQQIIKLKLQAQKEKIQELASDFQTVSYAMLDAAVALGLDEKSAAALNASIGVISGVLTMATGGPVGLVVGAVTIICSVAGVFGKKKKDTSHQQLMLALQQISLQLDEIKKQVFDLKLIVTRQHAELMRTLDEEFGKNKKAQERLSSMFSFEAFENRYGACLRLEQDMKDWVNAYPDRFEISDKEYEEFFRNDPAHGEAFRICLESLVGIKNTVKALGGLDYFFIFSFTEEDQNPDYRSDSLKAYTELLNYMKMKLETDPQTKNLSASQREVLVFKLLRTVPKTHGWERYKNNILQHYTKENLIADDSFSVFNKGIVSVSSVFYYIKALSFLAQFAPYVSYRGKLHDAREKIAHAIPGRMFFPESSSAKIFELVDFVRPYLTAATAQENLLSGSFVADDLAKSYVKLEKQAMLTSSRHWDQKNDPGSRFKNHKLVVANGTVSQNFLASSIFYHQPEDGSVAVVNFHENIKSDNYIAAAAALPYGISLLPYSQATIESKIRHISIRLKTAENKKLELAIDRSLNKYSDPIIQNETEIAQLKQELDTYNRELEDIKNPKATDIKKRDFFFSLPTSEEGTLIYAQVLLSENTSDALTFKRTDRLHQLLSIKNALDELNLDFNWRSSLGSAEPINKVEEIIERLQQ